MPLAMVTNVPNGTNRETGLAHAVHAKVEDNGLHGSPPAIPIDEALDME